MCLLLGKKCYFCALRLYDTNLVFFFRYSVMLLINFNIIDKRNAEGEQVLK